MDSGQQFKLCPVETLLFSQQFEVATGFDTETRFFRKHPQNLFDLYLFSNDVGMTKNWEARWLDLTPDKLQVLERETIYFEKGTQQRSPQG